MRPKTKESPQSRKKSTSCLAWGPVSFSSRRNMSCLAWMPVCLFSLVNPLNVNSISSCQESRKTLVPRLCHVMFILLEKETGSQAMSCDVYPTRERHWYPGYVMSCFSYWRKTLVPRLCHEMFLLPGESRYGHDSQQHLQTVEAE